MKILGLLLLLGGMTLCGVGLWLLLSPAQYAATTKIQVEPEFDMGINPPMPIYDPYLIQYTLKDLQSQIVLSNAIAKLNLNPTSLNRIGSFGNIRKHLRLTLIRNTKLITITFFSTAPNEAAQVANAIAEAYYDYRIKARREIIISGLEVLEHQFQEEEKQISIQQTNTEQKLEFHKLLGAKIEAEKLELQTPHALVKIVDHAEPPQFPVSPNRTLGTVLFVAGLLSLLGGILFLKCSRQPVI